VTTPKMTRQMQTAQEMERGRQVVAREERRLTLDRWIAAKKIVVFYDPAPKTGDPCDVWRAYIGDTLVATCTTPDYPTEHFMAQLTLAISALSDFRGTEPAADRPLSAVAQHVRATQQIIERWRREEQGNG